VTAGGRGQDKDPHGGRGGRSCGKDRQRDAAHTGDGRGRPCPLRRTGSSSSMAPTRRARVYHSHRCPLRCHGRLQDRGTGGESLEAKTPVETDRAGSPPVPQLFPPPAVPKGTVPWPPAAQLADFLGRTGFELRVLHLSHTSSPGHFLWSFWRWEPVYLGCLGTAILPVSASQVAGIAGVSHGAW
jgi:hypothetical protein